MLILSIAQAGLFPVLPGDPVFPFSVENAIVPDYPPVEQTGIVDIVGFSCSGTGTPFLFSGRIIQMVCPDWISQGDILSRLRVPEVRSGLYKSTVVDLIPGLESVQIIFPFHEFW